MTDRISHTTLSPLRAALANPEVAPLGAQYDLPSSVAVQRMWRAIDENRVERRGRFGVALWALSTAFVVAACVLFFVVRSPAPLHSLSSSPLVGTISAPDHFRKIELSDGSELGLEQGAELLFLVNEGGAFITAVRRGKVRFSVKPGGARKWSVDTGDFTVEVVGTVFVVDRGETRSSVAVERGVVRVRTPDGERILRASQHFELERETSDRDVHATTGPLPSPSQRSAAASGESVLIVDPDALPLEGEGDEDSVAEGEQRDAELIARANGSGLSLDAVLSAADAARQRGDSAAAARLFRVVVERAGPGDPRRGMAALSFARVSGDAGATADLLALGLASIPPGLREPALAHLVDAYQRAGRLSDARAAAHRYLAEFPQGPRAEAVRKGAALR